MKIPKKNRDLRIYVFRRDLMHWLLYALWMCVWIGGAIHYNQQHKTYPPERLLVGWRLILFILVITVVGFFLCRMRKMLADRTFVGTVERADNVRSYTTSNDPGAKNAVSYDFRMNTSLCVRKPNGKKKKIRFEQKDQFYTYYYPGTPILHYHGLPYPIRTDGKTDLGYLCVACGRIRDTKDEACDVCGHSLIDPADVCIKE